MDSTTIFSVDLDLLLDYLCLVDVLALSMTCRQLRAGVVTCCSSQQLLGSIAGNIGSNAGNSIQFNVLGKHKTSILHESSRNSSAEAIRTSPEGAPLACSGAAAAYLGHHVMVHGGNVQGVLSNRLLRFTPLTLPPAPGGSRSPPRYCTAVRPAAGHCPLPREGHCMLACHGGLVVHGGELRLPSAYTGCLMACHLAQQHASAVERCWWKHLPLAQRKESVRCMLQCGAVQLQHAAHEPSEVSRAVLAICQDAPALQHAMHCAAEGGGAIAAATRDLQQQQHVAGDDAIALVCSLAEHFPEWRVASHGVWFWREADCAWYPVVTMHPGPAVEGHAFVQMRGNAWHRKAPPPMRYTQDHAAADPDSAQVSLSLSSGGVTPAPRTSMAAQNGELSPSFLAVAVGGCRRVLRGDANSLSWGMCRDSMLQVHTLRLSPDPTPQDGIVHGEWLRHSACVEGGGDPPAPRNGAASAAIDPGVRKPCGDAVLVMGGFDGKRNLDDTWTLHCYGLSTVPMQWRQVHDSGPSPPARTDACLVRTGRGMAVLLGGMDTCNLQDVWSFRLHRGWRQHTLQRTASASAGAGAGDNQCADTASPVLQLACGRLHPACGYEHSGQSSFGAGMVACAVPVQAAPGGSDTTSPLLWVAFGEDLDWRGRVLGHLSTSAIVAVF